MKDILCKPLGTYRHPNFNDITGQRFGRLVAVKYKGQTARNVSVWVFLCDCGKYTDAKAANVKHGTTKSCGCFGTEKKTTHGLSGTPEYEVWTAMWQRCTNPRNKNFDTYKDRAPPESWRNFSVFIADMGQRPDTGYSIERVNNDKPYGPDNCKWMLTSKQANNTKANRRLEFAGETLTLSEWAKRLGICNATLRERLAKWPRGTALTKSKLEQGERHDKTNV